MRAQRERKMTFLIEDPMDTSSTSGNEGEVSPPTAAVIDVDENMPSLVAEFEAMEVDEISPLLSVDHIFPSQTVNRNRRDVENLVTAFVERETERRQSIHRRNFLLATGLRGSSALTSGPLSEEALIVFGDLYRHEETVSEPLPDSGDNAHNTLILGWQHGPLTTPEMLQQQWNFNAYVGDFIHNTALHESTSVDDIHTTVIEETTIPHALS